MSCVSTPSDSSSAKRSAACRPVRFSRRGEVTMSSQRPLLLLKLLRMVSRCPATVMSAETVVATSSVALFSALILAAFEFTPTSDSSRPKAVSRVVFPISLGPWTTTTPLSGSSRCAWSTPATWSRVREWRVSMGQFPFPVVVPAGSADNR